MEGRLLARARQQLLERQRANRSEELRRREEVYDRLPRVREIDGRLRGIMTELVGLALGAATRSAEDMAAESLRLQDERAALLEKHGWPGDYLNEILDCRRCGDRGHLDDGSPCECLRALYKKEQTAELSPLLHSDKECFENFRLSYYDAEGDDSPRKRMDRIFRICRSYAENFAPGAGSLLFVVLVYLIYIPLSVLIPSSSGLATLSIPVVAPLGRFAGVDESLVITAFQSASGLVNIITPTAAVVMGGLAFGHVPYDRWVRFVWKLILIFFLLTLAFLVVPTLL